MMRSNGRAYTIKNNKNRFFFPEEYLTFYENLKSKQQHTVHCQINTGARINELQHVKVKHVVFQNNFIRLTKTKTKAKKKETKGKERYVMISTQFRKYLKRYVRTNKLKPEDRLNILSTPAIDIGMKKAAKLSGLDHPEDFSSHTIRKTCETYMMTLGIADSKILVRLGHDLKTAVSAYIAPDIFNAKQRLLMRDILGDLYA